MTKSLQKALHSPFENAVIDTVSFLSDNYQLHKKFRHKKDLIARFGMSKQFYNSVERGDKNIPAMYWDTIKKILIDDFKVSKSFLEKHTGTMFSTQELNEKSASYISSGDRLKSLTKENDRLKEELSSLKELVETQKDLIKMLKKQK